MTALKLNAGDVARLAIAVAAAININLAEARDPAQVRAFRKLEPCPVTGQHRGACPGWQVDHIVPLCAGGEDKPSNMQWLAVDDHKWKTFVDVRECKKIGKLPGADKALRQ